MNRRFLRGGRRAALAGIGVFVLSVAGVAAALSAADDDAAPAATRPAADVSATIVATGAAGREIVTNGAAPASTGRGGESFGFGADGSQSGGYGGCPVALDGVLKGGKLQADLGGFPTRLLAAPFTLAALSLRAERTCYDQANPDRIARSFDTTWIHDPSKVGIFVSQQEQPRPEAGLLSPNYARFWADGFVFNLSLNFGAPDPLTGQPSYLDPADAIAVLEAAVAQLAPALDRACSHRFVTGDYPDLVAIGVGDFRPALPAGYTEQFREFTRVVEPPASCNAPKMEGMSAVTAYFGFSDGAGSLNISINGLNGYAGLDASSAGPGSLNWANDDFSFSLNWDPARIDDEAVHRVGRALDLGFDSVCFISYDHVPGAIDFAAEGIVEPIPPEGYSLENGFQISSRAFGGCAQGVNGLTVRWYMHSQDGGAIEAGVLVGPQNLKFSHFLFFEGHTFYWKDDRGRSYFITPNDGVQPDRGMFVAIALSMDPTFTEAKLEAAPSDTAVFVQPPGSLSPPGTPRRP